MLRFMNDNRQRMTETLGQAARRLLAELEARVRPAGEKPAQIAEDSRDVSGAAERAGEESANREAASHPRQQFTVRPGGLGRDGLAIGHANDNNRLFAVREG